MKLKKIFVISILLLSIFLIYLTTMDRKVYFLALGDSISYGKNSYLDYIKKFLEEKELLEEYRNEFIKDDERITDLIKAIEENEKIVVDGKEKTIKNALIKADLLTLSIGNEELFYKMQTEDQDHLYTYIDEMITDMETLFKLIREYCKEDIFILGYMNPFNNNMQESIRYANQKLQNLSKKYEIVYVNLSTITKEDFNWFTLKETGHKKITDILLPQIEQHLLLD